MTQIDEKVIYPELSYKICGFCFGIQNKLGRYLNEKQYADALEKTLKGNGLKYIRENPILPSFTGERDRRNIVDFIIEDKIIVEFKASDFISKKDYFQVMRYLISSNKKLGLIFNFRQKYLRPKRIINNEI